MENIIFIFVFILLTRHVESDTSNPWVDFVKRPTRKNFLTCQKQIKESLVRYKVGDTTATFRQFEAVETKFLSMTSVGNVYAAELCMQLYPLFQGHVDKLEFFDQSLGKFSKRNPKMFLKLMWQYLKEYDGRAISLRGILGNYGDEYVDKLDLQIEEAKGRLKIFETVPKDWFPEMQKRCVEELKEILDELINSEKERKGKSQKK